MATVEYYGADESHETFDKYYVDNDGIIRNKKTDIHVTQHTNKDDYKTINLVDNDGKRKTLMIHRIIASTFLGRPPTPAHTPDHKNRIRSDNTLDNIRWKDPTEQRENQERPETYKSALIIVRDGVEMTVKEWVKHLESEKTPFENVYTKSVINHYAQRKQHGFSYKVFDDFPGEKWKKVIGSKQWEVSNMKRVKYKTKYAENVLETTQLYLRGGYPTIKINGKNHPIHILCFQAFNPDIVIQSGEIVRHKHDDRLDFRPEKLLIGTQSQNITDAYKNGKYNDTKTEWKSCVSYINGVKEREHISLSDAARFLRENGWPKAIHSNISKVIDMNKTRYGRTWT
ncbi:HNH endonuclease [Paramecium bursaria Chlorella virus NYs1]|uniref:HNH nuclease domain-containing protein n=1 Tax=Paramecium bursaria Chlorella virus NYs1 TaxID=83442 RepID=M1I870_9PHYC|nr:HNH endonuclease [Paramecium bursaria Chlorella virus NYs1]AGE58709.1 hypothetical protein PBCVNYs1_382L [Paramecium bursaria Chlorella virus NYs1]